MSDQRFPAQRQRQSALELAAGKGQIRLAVQDWGKGFDPERIEPGHLGLQGIRERVRLLGGSAIIDSAPRQGTRITVELPLI